MEKKELIEVFKKLLPIYEECISENWDRKKIFDNHIHHGMCLACNFNLKIHIYYAFAVNYNFKLIFYRFSDSIEESIIPRRDFLKAEIEKYESSKDKV